MTKTIFIVLLVALLLHVLGFVGLLGYGVVTGRFDAEQRAQYLATWRGEKLVPPPEEETVEEVKESPQEAATRIAEAEIGREVLTLEIQRQLERIRNMMAAVESARGNLDKQLAALHADEEKFETRRAEQGKAAREEGFAKQLQMFSRMTAKSVRSDFMKMPDEKVARLLAAMRPDTAKKILNEFKNDQEQQKRLRVMALIETLNVVKDGSSNETAL